jgi:cation diffusion facilitator family transporter
MAVEILHGTEFCFVDFLYPREKNKMKNAYKSIKRILWIILFANIAVAMAKIGLGYAIDSASVLADGFHSLTDGSSNIIGLVGMSFASKPVDDEHPYGHGKYETLSSLMIVGMLFFLSFQIIGEAFNKFANPVVPTIDMWTFIIMAGTLVINLFVTVYEYNEGKKLHSTLLMSDAMHTRSDVFVTLGVILSLVLVKIGLPVWIDPLVSLIVAGVIIYAAYEIFKMASAILLDSRVVDPKIIADVVTHLPEVKGVHHIRSRGTLANPALVGRTIAAIDTARRVGFPEAIIPLGDIVIDLTLSPKSKSGVNAISKAIQEVKNHPLPVPPYLRLTPVNMKDDDKYDYGRPDIWAKIQYLPDGVKDLPFYVPNESSPYENTLKHNLDELNKIKRTKDIKSLK